MTPTNLVRVNYAARECLGKSVAVMPLTEWQRLVRADGLPTELVEQPSNLSNTGLLSLQIVVAASGCANAAPGMQVARLDLGDAPLVINVDKYTVVENLPAAPIYSKILAVAGVNDSPELRCELAQNVYVVMKAPPSKTSHHFADFPEVFLQARKKGEL